MLNEMTTMVLWMYTFRLFQWPSAAAAALIMGMFMDTASGLVHLEMWRLRLRLCHLHLHSENLSSSQLHLSLYQPLSFVSVQCCASQGNVSVHGSVDLQPSDSLSCVFGSSNPDLRRNKCLSKHRHSSLSHPCAHSILVSYQSWRRRNACSIYL